MLLVDTIALVSSSYCVVGVYSIFSLKSLKKGKGKVFPLQARCSPESG